METVGVIAIIGKRVSQKILADATSMAAQPPVTKCDTTIMRTATARVLGTMTGINTKVTRCGTAGGTIELVGHQHSTVRQLNAMLQGHQGDTGITTRAVRTTPGTEPRGLAQRTAALRMHPEEVPLRPSASSRCRCLQSFALGCPPRHDLQAATRLVRLSSHNHPLSAPSLPP